MKARLPDDLRFGAIALAVTDLERSVDYYRRQLGLELLERQGARATLGAGERRLLELEQRRWRGTRSGSRRPVPLRASGAVAAGAGPAARASRGDRHAPDRRVRS